MPVEVFGTKSNVLRAAASNVLRAAAGMSKVSIEYWYDEKQFRGADKMFVIFVRHFHGL